MLKPISVILLTAFIITFIPGCSNFTWHDNKITIYEEKESKTRISIAYNWMGPDAKAPIWEARLREFQDLHKNDIDLEMIPVVGGGTGIRMKIQTDFASNSAADFIVFYDGKEILPYVKGGYIADLTDILETDPDLRDRFIEDTMETATFEGKIYGIPLVQAVLTLYANSRLFSRYGLDYPQTYEELKEIIKVFKQNNITPIAIGNKSHEKSILLYSVLSQRILKPGQFEKASYSENGATFLDDGFVHIAEVIMEMAELGAFPEGVNKLERYKAISMFSNEESAMLFEGSWGVGSIKEDLIPYVDPILMPVFPETENYNSICGFTEMNLLVNSNVMEDAIKKKYAPQLIKFVTEPEFVKEFAEGSGSFIPTVKDVKLDYNVTNPVLVKVSELFNNASERGPRLFSYLTPGQMIALREGVSNMLDSTGTPLSNMEPLAEKTFEENEK